MDTSIDFLQWLDSNMAYHILMSLDAPADLVHASSVSRFWRQFVITNGISKQLCLKKFPQLSNVELYNPTGGSTDVGSSGAADRAHQENEHNAYASLLHALAASSLSPKDSIVQAISASSTDNYPDESIINTLSPGDRYINRGSYWSSKGQSDPAVPETLLYKLRANLCIISEIKIQPFEAFFQPGNPIYSAQFVRFRMGHPKCPKEIEKDLQNFPLQQPADDKIEWTYTSQDFPMVQENLLQEFKLPEPVLCIGGFLQIELSGRVQRQEMDGLFYICISHVRVMGRSLSPAFDLDILELSGKFLMKYHPEDLHRTLEGAPSSEDNENIRVLSPEELLWGRVGLLEYLMGGNQPAHMGWDEDDDEEDELDEMLIL